MAIASSIGNSSQSAVTVSVVIPVYRSARTLPELHRRIVEVLGQGGIEFEIIFVDDCGGDGSWSLIQSLARADARVRGILLSRNFGQHAATICGIARANGNWIVTLDDDLEQLPESICLLLAKANEGYALVYGVYPTRSHSLWRNATSSIARRMFRLAIPSLNYEYTSFRVIDRQIAKTLESFDSPFPFIDGYLSWLTHSCASVEVP